MIRHPGHCVPVPSYVWEVCFEHGEVGVSPGDHSSGWERVHQVNVWNIRFQDRIELPDITRPVTRKRFSAGNVIVVREHIVKDNNGAWSAALRYIDKVIQGILVQVIAVDESQ